MSAEYSQAELEAYLDEALTPTEMAEIEAQVRQRDDLMQRLQAILNRRDAGLHSLGEIWRRHRISCLDRETLGSYLLGVLAPEHADYVRFHLQQIGCRLCQANVDDLRQRQLQLTDSRQRQRRYFQSSAGYLHRA